MHKTPLLKQKLIKITTRGNVLCSPVNYVLIIMWQQHLNCMPCGENKSRVEILFVPLKNKSLVANFFKCDGKTVSVEEIFEVLHFMKRKNFKLQLIFYG
jgi:hypothetical protein